MHNTIFDTWKIITEIERSFGYYKRPDTLTSKFNETIRTVLLKDGRITENFVNEIINSLHKKGPNDQSRERNDVSNQIYEMLAFNNIKFLELKKKLKESTNIDPTKELDSTIHNLKTSIDDIIKILKKQWTEINEAYLSKVRELIICIVLLKWYENLKTMQTKIAKGNFLCDYGVTNLWNVLEYEWFSSGNINSYDVIAANKKNFDSKKFLTLVEDTIGHNSENDSWRLVVWDIKKSINTTKLNNEETKNTDNVINMIINNINSIVSGRNLSEVFYKELKFRNKIPRNHIDSEKWIKLLSNEIKELLNIYINIKPENVSIEQRAAIYDYLDKIVRHIVFYTGIKQELEKEKNTNLESVENENKEFMNSTIELAKEKEYDKLKINEVNKYIKGNYNWKNIDSIIKKTLEIMNNWNITNFRELLVKNHKFSRYKIDIQNQKLFLKNLLDILVKSKSGQQSEWYNLQDFWELSEQDLVKSIIFYCSIINILDQKNKVADEQAKIRRWKVELFRLLGGKD